MEEAIFYNALSLALKSDYARIAQAWERHGRWRRAWEKLPHDLKSGINPKTEWQKLETSGVRLTLQGDLNYPALLNEIPLRPFGIYYLGELTKNELTLAVVGTRKATVEGKDLAKKFSGGLAESGFTIVSGLALGIDAAAHEGCLGARGKTVAVLANGLNRFYPATNEKLARRLLQGGGAVVSEYPLGAEALPYRFLERNRLVSGLARGLLVVEAPVGSGALVTARFALDQNREVFVIPGPVNHPNFGGSHQLIRSGAILVTSPEEILLEFGLDAEPIEFGEKTYLSSEEEIIYEMLKKSGRPLDVDKIAELCNLEVSVVNRGLSYLIVKKLIQETEGGYTLL